MLRLRRTFRGLAVLALAGALAAPVPSANAAAAGAADPPADVYRLLEDPEATGIGQEPAHAELTPYADTASALEGGSHSPWTASLDGTWKLHMSKRPEDVPKGFFSPGYDTAGSGWKSVEVPHTWQTDGLDHPVFRNIPTEMYPDDPPKVPHDVNPTGAYVRNFELPGSWQRRRTFLRFEGVTSGYLVWVNGAYAGYDQGGYTPPNSTSASICARGRTPSRSRSTAGVREPTWRTTTSGASRASSARSSCTPHPPPTYEMSPSKPTWTPSTVMRG